MDISLKKNEVLFNQGDDKDKCMFVVVKGKLSVRKMVNSIEVDCGILEPGDIFGEISLILGKSRAASIKALENSTIVKKINKNDFIKSIQNNPEIAWKLVTKLATKTEMLDNIQELFLSMSGSKNKIFRT